MKKKRAIIGIGMLIIIVIIILLMTRPESLGNINHSYSEPSSTTSTISFSGETGNRIRFSVSSEIQSGDLDIILYDSKGAEIYKLDESRELESFFTLNKSDIYTLAVERNNFIGHYNVKVHKVH